MGESTFKTSIEEDNVGIGFIAENVEQEKISATSSEATTSFSQEVKAAILLNAGNDAVHVNFDATATTNHFKLAAGASLSIDLSFTDIHTICAGSDSTTVYAIGIW